MAPLPTTLQNFTAFIDGFGLAGKIKEGTPPKVAIQTEEALTGGMAATVDIDMGAVEKLEASMTFIEYSPLLYTNLGVPDLPFTLRGSQRTPDGADQAVIYQMRGLLKENDPASFQTAKMSEPKASFTAHYLKVTIADVELIEIDAQNMVRKIGGIDQLAGQRAALGL